MIATFFQNLVEAYIAPRRSVRSLLDRGLRPDVALMMVALGFLISAILMQFVPGGIPDGASGPAFYLSWIVTMVIQYFFLSALIFWFGKISGGTGTWHQTLLAVGWHTLVLSFVTPLWSGVTPENLFIEQDDGTLLMNETAISGNAMLLAFLAMALWFWLLAQFVAELHSFKNTWGVLGVLIGVPMAVAFFLMMIVSGFAVQQHGG